MEIRNIIVYFPWGAGGNLIQNILSLSPGYQMISETGEDVTDKETFIVDYYNKPVDPNTWLKREWSTRTFFGNRYCLGESPRFWNPEYSLVYTTHGENRNMSVLEADVKFAHWDRYNVDAGNIPEQLCPNSVHDFKHVFMIPDDIKKITKVYYSKNPGMDQLHLKDADEFIKVHEALMVNTNQCLNLYKLRSKLVAKHKTVTDISPDVLLTTDGYFAILELIRQLNLNIDGELVKTVHGLWLTSTQHCYKQIFNKELN